MVRMNLKMKIIIFIAIVCFSGLPMWFTTYTQFINNSLFSFYSILVTAICGSILGFVTIHKFFKILFFVIAAQQISFLIKVYLDCRIDPTNHNLVPFEIIILFIEDFVVCAIGVAIGVSLRTIKR
jgi:hypothetical protein